MEVSVLRMKVNGDVNVQQSIRRGIELAREKGILIDFEFEGITIEVGQDSNPKLIWRDFLLAKQGSRPGKVCAYPIPRISEQDRAMLREAEFVYS